jgi:hypothetical protein
MLSPDPTACVRRRACTQIDAAESGSRACKQGTPNGVCVRTGPNLEAPAPDLPRRRTLTAASFRLAGTAKRAKAQ